MDVEDVVAEGEARAMVAEETAGGQTSRGRRDRLMTPGR